VNSEPPIQPGSLVARNEEPIAVEVDRSVVMMSLDQGMYFGLEGTGPRIWALLERPRTVQQLCDELMAAFEVDPDVCFREVCAFLEEMRRAQLVRIHDEAPGSVRPTHPS
jgi:hypothetical protein